MNLDELRDRYEAFGDEAVYAEAVQCYERALAASPRDPQLLTDYGYLRHSHGRRSIRAAAQCYQRAIAADPGNDKPYWQLISALAELGHATEAVDRCQRLVAGAPDEPRGYRFLAAACLAAGDHEQAAQALRDGLAIAPEDTSLNELQGELFAAAGRPDDALACWQRAATLATYDYGISMHYSAADLLERQGKPDEAAREWRFIVQWCEDRGDEITADWPRRELERLQTAG